MASDVPPWVIAVAGSSGAIVANALVHPLDTVKTRLQTQIGNKQEKSGNATAGESSAVAESRHYDGTLHAIKQIIKDEGYQGLYSGLPGSSVSVVSSNFVYFYAYGTLRALFVASNEITSIAKDLALGTAAGAATSIFITPLSSVTTAQQTDKSAKPKSMIQMAREISSGPNGYAALWSGIQASLVLSVNPAITYAAYEQLRNALFSKKTTLKPYEAFLLGALSKMIATLITQPLIVAKATLQSRTAPKELGRPFKSFQEVLRYIVKHEGVGALYKGLAPQLLKGLLVQGILMMIKERVELAFIFIFRYILRARQQIKAPSS